MPPPSKILINRRLRSRLALQAKAEKKEKKVCRPVLNKLNNQPYNEDKVSIAGI